MNATRKITSNNEQLNQDTGMHGIGDKNKNGETFINFCPNYDLMIVGTLFPQETCRKITWVSPGDATKNQIEHIAEQEQFPFVPIK
jgi:hypothetical protein